jgi:hypothetical protein
VTFGGGLEARFEKLQASLPATVISPAANNSVNWLRPWVRLNGGYTFPGAAVKPFVGLDLAFPLVSQSDTGALSDSNKLVKFFAPSVQVACYGGVRF